MSDSSSTPPKPKLGSLRDRIAAFETKAANPPSERAPQPRPRPTGFASWKPKQSSPPSSPEPPTASSAGINNNNAAESVPRGGSSSVNAVDAKESIARGSLKERMAALQGRGGFGSPVAPSFPAPKHAVEKSKWMPSLQVVSQPAVGEDDDRQNKSQEGTGEEVEGSSVKPSPSSIKSPQLVPKSPPSIVRSPPSALEDDASRVSEEVKEPRENDEDALVDPPQADEGEEERQRRAAIAARMAKLGGVRFDMGPAIYGQSAHAALNKNSSPLAAALEPEVQLSQAGEEISTESIADDDTSSRSPAAMPMATIPKRTAPSRRKPAKTVSTGTITAHQASSVLPTTDAPAEILVEEKSLPVDDITTQIIEPAETHGARSEAAEVSKQESEKLVEGLLAKEERGEEDEDEDSRKKYVEKLAKMGGINPFAYTLMQRSSLRPVEDVTTSPPRSPPIPTEKPTLHRPVHTDKSPTLKRASGGSTRFFDYPSGTDMARRANVDSVTSGRSMAEAMDVGKRASVGSVKSITRQEGVQAVQGITEEPESIMLEEVTSVYSPTQEKLRQPVSTKDERNSHDIGIQSEEHTNDEDKEAMPQLLASVPPVVPPSFQQEGIRERVDAGIITGVIQSPPPHSPSTTIPSTTIDAITRTEVPLSPRIFPIPRDHSVDIDRLRGPAPPRRVVPQTPIHPTRDLDGQTVSTSGEEDIGTDEEEVGTDLASSTLSIPSPAMTGPALRTIIGTSIDDEESEQPLRVPPPPDLARLVPDEKGRRGSCEDTDDESNASDVALPVRLNVASSEDAKEAVMLNQPLPLESVPSALVPAVFAEHEDAGSDSDDNTSYEQEHITEEGILHTAPPSDELSQSISSAAACLVDHIPFFVPPRLSEGSGVRHVPVRSVSGPLLISPFPSSALQLQHSEDEEKEVLDEDEGDPIDPAFHSPNRRVTQAVAEVSPELLGSSSTTVRAPPPAPLFPPAPAYVFTPSAELNKQEQMKSEEEGKRKGQTIAERMARLGGIKFGAAPGLGGNLPVSSPRRFSSDEPAGVVVGEVQDDVPGHEKVQLTQEHVGSSGAHGNEGENEEENRVRRERIAAKLVGMGAMRIGMMPTAMPPRQSHVLGSSELQQASTSATAPFSKVPVAAKRSDASQSGTSEDGVKVEVEESEIEEVGYEEAKGNLEEGSGEEVPPPPPPRIPMRRETGALALSSAATVSPASPMTRPPIPVSGPFRRTSVQSTGSTKKSQQSVQAQPSKYILVDEPQMMDEGVEDDVPPLPPSRPLHQARPSHQTPSSIGTVTPTSSLADRVSSQWELPAIPSSSLDGDLSASWSDTLVYEHQQAPPPPLPLHQDAPVPVPPPVATPVSQSLNALHLNSDELIAIWGRVGVQVCEIATTMHDHSKKTLIGDGTYRGFVDAVLREVPNASKPESKLFPYGYLVYLQNGVQVQKRASEIMPGDVVEIVDARFKGHKGLSGYQQYVGTGAEGAGGGGPVVGVISEFEPKKSKLRVFQANQHVGQQVHIFLVPDKFQWSAQMLVIDS